MIIYIIAVTILTICISSFFTFYYKKSNTGIPFVTEVNAKDVASNFLHVMETLEKRYGDIFEIKIKDKKIIYVLDPLCYHTIQNSAENFDFVEVSRTAKIQFKLGSIIDTHEKSKNLTKLLKTVLLGQNLRLILQDYSKHISKILNEKLNQNQQTLYLFDLCLNSIFITNNKALYGYNFECEDLIDCLIDYGLEIPSKKADKNINFTSRKVKDESLEPLLQKLSELLQGGKNEVKQNYYLPKSLINAFCDESTVEERARTLFMVMWASIANTLPSAFWLIYDTALNPDIIQEIRKTLLKIRPKTNNKFEYWKEDEIKQFPKLVECCVMESIRIHLSEILFRVAIKDVELTDSNGKSYYIKKGKWICMIPRFVHYDESLYPNPSHWNPKRFLDNDEFKKFYNNKIIKSPFNAFGGGQGACPAKMFAIESLSILLCTLIYNYDYKLKMNDHKNHFDSNDKNTGIPDQDIEIIFTNI